jgi:hypothetical protein
VARTNVKEASAARAVDVKEDIMPNCEVDCAEKTAETSGGNAWHLYLLLLVAYYYISRQARELLVMAYDIRPLFHIGRYSLDF